MGLPPIFFVSGAFGTGKTTLAPLVASRLPECLVFDVDWLLEPLSALVSHDLHVWEPGWPALGGIWFAIAGIAARGGRPTVLFSACDPRELERQRPPDLVGESHALLLDCADAVIRARLAAREDWPPASTLESLQDAASFRCLGLPALRTDESPQEETSDRIAAWVRERLTSA
jgi:hypothetical protein